MNVFKSVLYFVLSYIQSPFDYIAGKLVVLTFIAGIIAYFYFHSTSYAYTLFGFSFAVFALKKLCDVLLSKLRP